MQSRTRLLLTFSLGSLLLLEALAGAGALVVLSRIRAGEAALRTRYAEKSAALDQIRSGIYFSGTLARDYFVEPDSPEAPALLKKLTDLESSTKRALGPSTGTLRAEVFAYWKVLELMTEIAQKRHTPGVDAYFRRQLAERRDAMLRIADETAAALAGEVKRSEADLATLYARFRLIVAAGLALMIAGGALLSIVTIRKIVRLEIETRALSTQLVRAQEDERRAIARELHDEIGQKLSGLLLEVGSAASAAPSDTMRSHLQSIAALASNTIEEARRIALSLRPSMLDDLGLIPALEWQAREVGNRTGLNVEVHADESAGELPDGHRTCIYRVAQEALQNCVRHAGAHQVRIGLEKAAKTVALAVQDDGQGFTVTRRRGLGVLGMEERVRQLGGRLRIESQPGRGTMVRAELPI